MSNRRPSGPISWSSRIQSRVGTSLAEAEYILRVSRVIQASTAPTSDSDLKNGYEKVTIVIDYLPNADMFTQTLTQPALEMHMGPGIM
ncbi:BQ5605_C015g07904 [Microbotryum silenes-dioicae]|uniref:BQ5605_C015g07904 protein n=1 Tax=Microbotryum silenes-dioicae TaxID=796604 RepID=A0A2X0MMV7_9BASI|nr:BQ5605_C015g07904 [Microbotryum silenes-dioicae]